MVRVMYRADRRWVKQTAAGRRRGQVAGKPPMLRRIQHSALWKGRNAHYGLLKTTVSCDPHL
jgi:hypothetical protein